MKIEITDDTIHRVVDQIRADALAQITKTVRKLEDEELLREIRSSAMTNKEKVLTYLQRTNINGGEANPRSVDVLSEYLRTGLGMSALQMSQIRIELGQEGSISVWRTYSRLHIHYRER